MKKYRLAIVGATGLVGRTALTVLEEKNYLFLNMFFLLLKNLLVVK